MANRVSRRVIAGGVAIGGGAPVSVQSMAKRDLGDIEGNLGQIRKAKDLGCDLMRLAVPSVAAAEAFAEIVRRSPLPLVADTHFDWRVTLAAIEAGAAKVRINPGNMAPEGLARVAAAAGARGIPIRVGGNSGSIRHGNPEDGRDLAEALAEDALVWARRLDELDFHDVVVSIKAPDAATTVRANRIVAAASDYPLHLGVTAAGPKEDSLLKSAAAIGSLLLDGIGDTIRLSFTGDPAEEVASGRDLLRAVGLLRDGPEVMSCPTCGRCRVDLPALVRDVKAGIAGMSAPLRIAVMGCEVNGPGEARAADVGIAVSGRTMTLFRAGEIIGRVAPEKAVEVLLAEAEKLVEETARRSDAPAAGSEFE